MTAPDGNIGDEPCAHALPVRASIATDAHVERTCRAAVGGRRAARALAEWAKRFGLAEAEFQLLWRLRSAPSDGLDQTALAHALAFSPAQISASVERLRARALICVCTPVADRRRHHWQLSSTARVLLDEMVSAAASLRFDLAGDVASHSNGNRHPEAAA